MARLNENENENEGTGSRGLFTAGRYNTYKIAKQAFVVGDDIVAPSVDGTLTRYDDLGGWDAENKGWVYLAEFEKFKSGWFEELHEVAQRKWAICDLFQNKDELKDALADIVDAAGEREDRFAECFHQQDAEGCITYWLAMLGIDPAKHPNTYQLIRYARKLGEMVVMCLKESFNVPRPSQICPAIVPMFDPPRTASYPAGHSLQSYLISYFLKMAMPGIPQSDEPASWGEIHKGIFALARRVAENRVIAGVHYDIDSEGGFLVAQEMNKWFKVWSDGWFDQWVVDGENPQLPAHQKNLAKLPRFAALLKGARSEFPQFKRAV